MRKNIRHSRSHSIRLNPIRWLYVYAYPAHTIHRTANTLAFWAHYSKWVYVPAAFAYPFVIASSLCHIFANATFDLLCNFRHGSMSAWIISWYSNLSQLAEANMWTYRSNMFLMRLRHNGKHKKTECTCCLHTCSHLREIECICNACLHYVLIHVRLMCSIRVQFFVDI